ncbi:MAG: YggT family protein [Acidobacteria bacterium]|nr:MAG: YggT family protein [Acidobacteriota bacterium]
MLLRVYPIFQAIVASIVMLIAFLMILRLIFNYVDPNPFGFVGRIEYLIKKRTDRIVEPSAFFLSRLGLDTRLAPLITIFAFCIFGYFFLQILYNCLFTADGVSLSLINGDFVRLFGFLLYGFLGVYALLIVMRVIFSWFMDWTNPLMRFLVRLTDPILEPFRRMVPPLGILDISPMIVLFILWFIQATVATIFLR